MALLDVCDRKGKHFNVLHVVFISNNLHQHQKPVGDQSPFLQTPHGISVATVVLTCSYIFEGITSEPTHVAGVGAV